MDKSILINFILGELLHLANALPPFALKQEFYQLKDHILQCHGVRVGRDLQHIYKECYNCDGSGKIFRVRSAFGNPWNALEGPCWKCAGSGVYENYWVNLLRYRLGRREFHKPLEKFYNWEHAGIGYDDVIEGYIRHQHAPFYLYAEAAYWLALFFDRNLFFRKFGHSGYPATKFTPMVILTTLVFNIRIFPEQVHTRWTWIGRNVQAIRQRYCRHDFSIKQYQCSKCHAFNPEDDAPF